MTYYVVRERKHYTDKETQWILVRATVTRERAEKWIKTFGSMNANYRIDKVTI